MGETGVRQGARQGRDRGETSETSHLVKLSLPDIFLLYFNDDIFQMLCSII